MKLVRLEDLDAGDLFETSLTHRRGLVIKSKAESVGVVVILDCDEDDSAEVEIHGQVLVEALG